MESNGHEVPTEQPRDPYDRQLGAERSRGTRRGKRWTNLVAGAVGGLIATGPMSVAMGLLYGGFRGGNHGRCHPARSPGTC
jgi:hypothetical protein